MASPPPASPSPPSPSLLRHVINLDTTISLTHYTLTQPLLPRPIRKLLELSGDGRLLIPILLAVLLSPLPATSPLLHSLLLKLLIGALLDLIIIGTAKHLIRRPRPVYNKHMSLTFAVDHWSFPSGHASRVCFIACLIYLSSDSIPNMIDSVDKFVMVVIVWASATSVSRVLLGRHFVFDVVAGGGLGIVNAFFVFRFFNCDFLSSKLFSSL